MFLNMYLGLLMDSTILSKTARGCFDIFELSELQKNHKCPNIILMLFKNLSIDEIFKLKDFYLLNGLSNPNQVYDL